MHVLLLLLLLLLSSSLLLLSSSSLLLLFLFSSTGVEDRMSVIWEKGVVSVLAEQCCSTLLWFGLV